METKAILPLKIRRGIVAPSSTLVPGDFVVYKAFYVILLKKAI